MIALSDYEIFIYKFLDKTTIDKPIIVITTPIIVLKLMLESKKRLAKKNVIITFVL